jgi:DNA polymerase-3 subunit epsilon
MSSKVRSLESSGRDLSVIEIATTGFDPLLDRVIEIAVVKLRYGFPCRRYHTFVQPEVPILAAATAIHGVGWGQVFEARPFADVVPGLARWLGRSDLAGFDLRRFTLPFLYNEFERHDVDFPWSSRSFVDVGEIYRRYEPRDLAAAARHYLGPDRAVGGGMASAAEAVAEILKAQLARHEDLPRTTRGLPYSPWGDVGGWLRYEGEQLVFQHGPHRGRTLKQVAREDPRYLRSLTARGALWDLGLSIEAAFREVASEGEGGGRADPGR